MLVALCFRNTQCCFKMSDAASERTQMYKRSIYLFFGFCSIFIVILYIFIGLPIAYDAMDAVEDGNDYTLGLLNEGDNATVDLIELGQTSLIIRDSLEDDLSDFCNNYLNVQLTYDIDIESMVDDLVEKLSELDDFALSDLDSLQESLTSAKSTSEDIGDRMVAIENGFGNILYALIGLIFFIFIPCVLVVLDWQNCMSDKKYDRCLWLFNPVIVFIIFLLVVLLSIFAIVVVANAGELSECQILQGL